MVVTSPSFESDSAMPRKFTCDGGDMNPELQIQNVPSVAKSLALILHDPDAPRARGFTHWLVWNIDPKTTYIKEESVPPGAAEGTNDAGHVGYLGPCPPPGHGTHHYIFSLYALDIVLELPAETDKLGLEVAIDGHIVEQADLVGLYRR